MKKRLTGLVFIMLITTVLLCGCEDWDEEIPESGQDEEISEIGQDDGVTGTVTEDTEFGNVETDITIDDFNERGFNYGDSFDVSFSNGYRLEDIPYYNGYYARVGHPQLVAYPGTEHIAVAISSGGRAWDETGCSEGDEITIRLNTPGKYLDEQNALDMVYSDDREDYPDDVTFANFRAMSGGDILADTFYRGASPADNKHNRAAVTDRLLEENNIKFILDLADTPEKLNGYTEKEDFDSQYTLGLLQDGNIEALGLTAGYQGEDFKNKLGSGLRVMMKHEGPYYIQCTEGKDRTGFVCLLLEALCDASYEELESDYMISYKNYFGITRESEEEKYDAIIRNRLYDMLITLTGLPEETDFSEVSFAKGARSYLKECGLSEQETEDLHRFLTGRESQSDGQGGSALCISTRDLNGNPVNTADVFAKNRITVVNLWASWCDPCAREIPELDRMNEELKEQGCAVVGFLMDGEDPYGIEDAKDILDYTKASYLNVIGPVSLVEDFDLQGYPTTYFVDSDGTILGDPVIGARPDQYRETLDRLLSDI